MRLRMETSDAHRRLEARFDLQRALRDRVHLEDLLRGFSAVVPPLEARLAALLPTELLAGRGKSRLLAADLALLGLAQAPARPVPAALCADLPAALGVLYVLEGATLGGHAFSRQLRRAELTPRPLRYFDPYGPRTGAMWRACCDALRAASGRRDDATIAAANATFAHIAEALALQPVAAR